MLRRSILAFLGTFGVFLVIGLFLPNTSTVARSRLVRAEPEAIHALLADLERWPDWSGFPVGPPENRRVERDVDGNPVLVWGELEAVPGRMVVRASLPQRGVWYDLEYEGAPTTRGAVHFTGGGDGATRVTWSIREEYPRSPLARYRGILVSGSMGVALEDGLERLETAVTAVDSGGAAVETPPAGAPSPADPRVERAFEALGTGDLDIAADLLEAVLEEFPGHGRAALGLGLVHHQRKHYALARPQLEAARRAGPFPQQEAVDYYLGWCLYRVGEAEPARAAFLRYAAANPGEGDAEFGIGLVELEEGELGRAEARFRRAAELFAAEIARGRTQLASELAKTHARLADVYELRGDDPAARRELERCVQVWPPHYAAWYKLARVYDRLGLEAEARHADEQFEQWKSERGGGR